MMTLMTRSPYGQKLTGHRLRAAGILLLSNKMTLGIGKIADGLLPYKRGQEGRLDFIGWAYGARGRVRSFSLVSNGSAFISYACCFPGVHWGMFGTDQEANVFRNLEAEIEWVCPGGGTRPRVRLCVLLGPATYHTQSLHAFSRIDFPIVPPADRE